MYQIRPVQRSDYDQMAVIANMVRPEPITGDDMWEADERCRVAQDVQQTRLIGVAEDGRVCGWGLTEHVTWDPPTRWEVRVVVHPAERQRGLGSALYDASLRLARDGGGTEITTFVRGEDDASAVWAEHRGFVFDRQRTESVLDLKDWNSERWEASVARVRESGIRLELYEGLGLPEGVLRQLYELDCATGVDVPIMMPGTGVPSWETYRNDWLTCTEPRRVALAFDGDQLVGMSDVFLPNLPGKGAYTGYTAVLRAYRGRGIALALKVLTIDAAVRFGAPHMRTNNDPENAPMLAVNAKLGYKLIPGPKRYILHLA